MNQFLSEPCPIPFLEINKTTVNSFVSIYINKIDYFAVDSRFRKNIFEFGMLKPKDLTRV